jgi:hypothetical protein
MMETRDERRETADGRRQTADMSRKSFALAILNGSE